MSHYFGNKLVYLILTSDRLLICLQWPMFHHPSEVRLGCLHQATCLAWVRCGAIRTGYSASPLCIGAYPVGLSLLSFVRLRCTECCNILIVFELRDIFVMDLTQMSTKPKLTFVYFECQFVYESMPPCLGKDTGLEDVWPEPTTVISHVSEAQQKFHSLLFSRFAVTLLRPLGNYTVLNHNEVSSYCCRVAAWQSRFTHPHAVRYSHQKTDIFLHVARDAYYIPL